MQRPTPNRISQTQHTVYKAVDYSASPDPTIYAPEDGKITAYGPSGTCGNRLELTAGGNRHGFCHLEKPLVSVGQTVKRGQRIGVMGYTGTTIPVGPNGRHLHHVILQNGSYVYPPNLVNQEFIKEGEEMPITATQQDKAIKMGLRRPPSAAELNDTNWRNNPGLMIDALWANGGEISYNNKGTITQDAAEKLVTFAYRAALDIDPTPDQAGYWVERIKANPNTAYELLAGLGGNTYQGDPKFREKARNYDKDVADAGGGYVETKVFTKKS